MLPCTLSTTIKKNQQAKKIGAEKENKQTNKKQSYIDEALSPLI
jgi:hypothetical protein